MDNVQFEGDNFYKTSQINNIQSQNEKSTALTKLAMKLGAKNYAQAQMFLLGITILAVILTIFVVVTQFTNIGKKKNMIPAGAIPPGMMAPGQQGI